MLFQNAQTKLNALYFIPSEKGTNTAFRPSIIKMTVICKANYGEMCVALELNYGEKSQLQNYIICPVKTIFLANFWRARAPFYEEVHKMLAIYFYGK